MSSFALFVTMVAGAALQEDPPPPAPWKIESTLTLEEKDGKYVFVLEGTTNAPKETVLRARVYAVSEVDSFQGGKREDEEPLVWPDDVEAGQPSYVDFEVPEGKFKKEIYKFTRKPYSIKYRAKAHYFPDFNNKAVRGKLGEDRFAAQTDFTCGTPKDLARELRERSKEVYEDLVQIDGLFDDIKKAFIEHRKKYVDADWKKWEARWEIKVDRIYDRNKERYGMWAVWMEKQAKMRVGGMCDHLRSLDKECQEFFGGDGEALPRAQKRMDNFHVYYEEAIEVIGLDMPLEMEKVLPLLAAYEKGFAPVREWIGEGQGDWGKIRPAARRVCTEALLGFAPLLENRKRGYKFVNDVSTEFKKIVDLADAKADSQELKKTLQTHDEAVREFKRFAGLKEQ